MSQVATLIVLLIVFLSAKKCLEGFAYFMGFLVGRSRRVTKTSLKLARRRTRKVTAPIEAVASEPKARAQAVTRKAKAVFDDALFDIPSCIRRGVLSAADVDAIQRGNWVKPATTTAKGKKSLPKAIKVESGNFCASI